MRRTLEGFRRDFVLRTHDGFIKEESFVTQDVLVSTEWLAEHLEAPNQRIVDCSWFLPELKHDGYADYLQQHIPGAAFFSIEDISDHGSPYAHMLPSAEKFAQKVGGLGIDNDTRVVVYDANYVSARVWWMFCVFGHDNVVVLEGGFNRWMDENRPLEGGSVSVAAKSFRAQKRPELVADWKEVLENVSSKRAQLLDVRTAKRFRGELPTGYPGVPTGQIPGSMNLPWDQIMDPTTKDFVPNAFVYQLLLAAGADPRAPVITTCGSGVTACIAALALHRLGRRDWKVYDGSWNEWAQRPEVPKVKVGENR
jgi:thiosulfate/3-mercaptopyruvate sulfurtransferase